MIPLVRAMLPGDATTDASILTARASDDHRRQAQVTARMEKRFGTGAFAKEKLAGMHGRHPEGDGAEGSGAGSGPTADGARGGCRGGRGADRKRRARRTAAGGVGGGGGWAAAGSCGPPSST